MSNRNRHGPPSSSSAEKRSSVSETFLKKKVTAVKAHLTKKRPVLGDVTNQKNVSLIGTKASISASSKPMVPCVSRTAKTEKESTISSQKKDISGDLLQESMAVKSSGLVASKGAISKRRTQPKAVVSALVSPSSIGAVRHALTSMICAPRRMDVSPNRSFSGSVSLDESMSTSDSLKSPEFEYIDNGDVVSLKSIERKTNNTLSISDNSVIAGRIHEGHTVKKIEASEVVDIDDNFRDAQFCAPIAPEIYEYLRVSEESKRPLTDFMEKIQKDINASMRAILVDWLVEVTEEYRLLPETLFLTVNVIDRYLSGNAIKSHRLQLLGVASMMIAAKYEEIYAPKVEDFCYVTDNTYSKKEVLQMESAVLKYLKFELTAPTVRCFLRRFVSVAQRTSEVPSLQLEYLADYLAELSLLEYSMLQYTPSLIAASATFLAKFILLPRKNPWNFTLRHYTCYQAWELRECVKALHWLCCNGSYNLPAIREKYSQHKFKFVAKKYCPPSMPPEVFPN
ncbi:hypothetical protein L6164_016216 [Bauhinia variegata]|uniref:Uncharacterized protein n=1 Tax=Bauhinia variegata TaxID=167791 RepID=A0ACB9NQ40_BAUVA|nr:hypothetical protein L6164_016216 [Bauhinia variegata]